MRRTKHDEDQLGAGAAEEAAFRFGVLYRTVEEHIDAFAAQNSAAFTRADVSDRLSQLLQAKALREQLRNPELVRQVRQNGTAAGLRGSAAALQAFHHAASGGGSLNGRRLSADARAKISEAQHKRWAKQRTQREKNRIYRERWYVKKYGHKPGAHKGSAAKGFSYQGKHWTQRPENQARVRALAKANAIKRQKQQ